MNTPRECLVMAKPAGPRCNMRCAYCYYLGKEAVLPRGPGRLPVDLLKRYIAQRIQSSSAPAVHFEWHGGEPTLLGLDYFRTIVRMQRAHLPPGRTVTNGLQTNGYVLDGAWAGFLAKEGFSVGLSLDGPADLHDAFRRSADGGPTHARVERAYALLKERGVFVNLLCVLHARNAAEPDRVYDYFMALGAPHLQFLPYVPRGTGAGASAAADPVLEAAADPALEAAADPVLEAAADPVLEAAADPALEAAADPALEAAADPALEAAADPVLEAAADPLTIGTFLCRVFDRWIDEGAGRTVIQNIDEALRPVFGLPHALVRPP